LGLPPKALIAEKEVKKGNEKTTKESPTGEPQKGVGCERQKSNDKMREQFIKV